MIASWSDRCTSKNGRRIPFLKGASLPLALSTVLVFWSPANENSWINAAFLFVMILAYYLSITAYCTPYNALIPELGHTQQCVAKNAHFARQVAVGGAHGAVVRFV